MYKYTYRHTSHVCTSEIQAVTIQALKYFSNTNTSDCLKVINACRISTNSSLASFSEMGDDESGFLILNGIQHQLVDE